MTAEQIIQDIQAIHYKGFHFVGWIIRNNARNKELSFALKQSGPMQQQEGGGANRNCFTVIEIEAVLDAVADKIEWNYIEPAMQEKAEKIILDIHYHTNLHAQLITEFGTKNTLKVKDEKNITNTIATISHS